MDDNTTEQAALEAVQGNKLYKVRDKANSYPEISAEQKRKTIAAAVRQQRANIRKNSSRPRVDLNNAPAVEAEIETYLQSCEEFGVCPTVLGLAASMGFSRVNLYAYLHNHPETESARLIDSFRCSCASVIAEASLNRTTDNATSIFLLKNCGQGLNDRQEVELTRGIDPAPRPSAAELWSKYYGTDGVELPD